MTLEARDLTFRYPCRGASPVLEGVNFTLRAGERVGLSAPTEPVRRSAFWYLPRA